MIEMRHITFSYGDKVIFHDRDFSFSDGIAVLTGPSGCGKTTLLRLISGLEKMQSGTLEKSADTVLLFQDNRLFPHLTCAQQLKAFAVGDQDYHLFLKIVELQEEENTPVEQLSGGMQRRLALARTLLLLKKDGILLMDEPFTGIDGARAERIMQKIREIHCPVIFSSHEQESISLADYEINI